MPQLDKFLWWLLQRQLIRLTLTRWLELNVKTSLLLIFWLFERTWGNAVIVFKDHTWDIILFLFVFLVFLIFEVDKVTILNGVLFCFKLDLFHNDWWNELSLCMADTFKVIYRGHTFLDSLFPLLLLDPLVTHLINVSHIEAVFPNLEETILFLDELSDVTQLGFLRKVWVCLSHHRAAAIWIVIACNSVTLQDNLVGGLLINLDIASDLNEGTFFSKDAEVAVFAITALESNDKALVFLVVISR